MELIGHRGCAMQYPENTVTAVARAAEHVDVVEIDVRRCSTGELVVFHDETIDRVTDGSGRVDDLPWHHLRELEVLGSGETVPRLSTVVEAIPESVALQIELKETGLAADVRATVAGAGHDVRVSSFISDALAEGNWKGGSGTSRRDSSSRRTRRTTYGRHSTWGVRPYIRTTNSACRPTSSTRLTTRGCASSRGKPHSAPRKSSGSRPSASTASRPTAGTSADSGALPVPVPARAPGS